MKTFGMRLKAIREKRGWSQMELAERAGVPYETIYRVERGTHQEPRVGIAVRLARTLGVSLDVLAGVYDESESMGAATALVGSEYGSGGTSPRSSAQRLSHSIA